MTEVVRLLDVSWDRCSFWAASVGDQHIPLHEHIEAIGFLPAVERGIESTPAFGREAASRTPRPREP